MYCAVVRQLIFTVNFFCCCCSMYASLYGAVVRQLIFKEVYFFVLLLFYVRQGNSSQC